MTDRVDSLAAFGGGPRKVWFDVSACPGEATVGRGAVGVHPLILEDIVQVDSDQDRGHGRLSVPHRQGLRYARRPGAFESQVSFYWAPMRGTFQGGVVPAFDSVRFAHRSGQGADQEHGADYLLYAMRDAWWTTIPGPGEGGAGRFEDLGRQAHGEPPPADLEAITGSCGSRVSAQGLWPLREVVSRLAEGESDLLRPETRLYFRDLYEHVIQIMDSVAGLLDIVAGMVDIYLSTISFRLNAIMKVLTLISTLFMPMTFVAGVYGMNFTFMPELSWPLGYPLAIGIMLLMSGGLFTLFKLKKWI
jgi:magnesium transporter